MSTIGRSTGRRLLAGAVCILVLVVAAAAGVVWLSPRYSVVLITIDTLRADRVGIYGRTENETPVLDRLAREGMFFETAYCDMPWTTGSMSSVMTGQYSSSHGVDLPSLRLKPEAVTMAEILRDRQYTTAAVVGSFPLDSVYGLDQGFETYDDDFNSPMIAVPGADLEHVPSQAPDADGGDQGFVLRKFQNDAYRPDEDVTDAAIGWLDKNREHEITSRGLSWIRDRLWGQPFFFWVHYFGPHEKLKGDIGLVDQEPAIIDAYDGDVEKSDCAVGRLIDHLRSLELLDRTLVIVHADHGQNLGEFGVVGHGMRLDEATVRIPMILRFPPKIPADLRRIDVAHNIDILPTVLALVGAEAANLAGRSLFPTAEDPLGKHVPAEQQIAYFQTKLPTIVYRPLLVPQYWSVLGPMVRSGVRTADWRYVEDRMTGACEYGARAERDGMGEWHIPDAKPLPEETCRKLQPFYLYPVSRKGDGERNVVLERPDVAKTLSELLRVHASQKSPLASQFNLSDEQEEKLRSLGYLK